MHQVGEEDLTPAEVNARLDSIRLSLAAENALSTKAIALSVFSSDVETHEEFEKVPETELCYKYEYCMVFKMVGPTGQQWKEGMEKCMPDYACSIIKALLEAQMVVYPYLSAQRDELLVLITVGDKALNEFTDDKNYLVELDDVVLQHKMEMGSKKDKWKGRVIEDHKRFFSRWGPYQHIWGKWESELRDLTIYRGLEKTGPRKHDTLMFKRGSLHRFKLIAMMIQADPQLMKGAGISLLTLLHKNHIDAFYPLHQPGQVQQLLEKTSAPLAFPWRQNFKLLKEYFGEKNTFWFVFMGHYSAWLVLPAIVGLAFQLIVWSTGPNFSHPVIPVFGAFICVWGIVMLEYWKRTESLYAFVWGMSDFESQEMQRPEYKGKLIRSYVDGRYMLYFPEDAYRNKMAASTSVIITLIMMVIGAVAGIYVMKYALSPSIGSNASTVASVVNTIQITIFNMLYTTVARKLVDNENHKTDTLYQDSLIMKMFMFQFVNSYASFFFIAFVAANLTPDTGTDSAFLGQCGYYNCMQPLSINLAIIFGTRLTITNLIDVLMQLQAHRSKVSENLEGLTDEEKATLSPPEHDYALQEFDPMMDSIVIFADAAIQYGFSTLFICALPIACACSLVANHVKVKLQAWKQLTMYQRPIPQGAQDIGSWHSIFSIITVMAVMTNAGLICFTMNILWKDKDVSNNHESNDGTHRAGFAPLGRLWIFLGFVVFLLIVQFFLSDWIVDEPEEVTIQKKRQDHFRSKVVDGIADDDYDEPDTEPTLDFGTAKTNCCGCEQDYVSMGAQLKGLDYNALRKALPFNETYLPPNNQLTATGNFSALAEVPFTRNTLIAAGIKVRDVEEPSSDDEDDDAVVCSVCAAKQAAGNDVIPSSLPSPPKADVRPPPAYY